MSEVELQTISIHVKVSPEERDRFQVAAQKLGLGLSTWMRMVANAALEPEAEPDEQPTGQ